MQRFGPCVHEQYRPVGRTSRGLTTALVHNDSLASLVAGRFGAPPQGLQQKRKEKGGDFLRECSVDLGRYGVHTRRLADLGRGKDLTQVRQARDISNVRRVQRLRHGSTGSCAVGKLPESGFLTPFQASEVFTPSLLHAGRIGADLPAQIEHLWLRVR